MKLFTLKTNALFLSLLFPFSAFAGDLDDVSMYKPVPKGDYNAMRGLITLEGPAGMFINPTTATLNANSSTIQYCMFLPARNTDVIGNGLMASYGVTDWLEIGALGRYVDPASGSSLSSAGPFARVRLTQHDGLTPQIAVGGYSYFGDDPVTNYGAFGAASWYVPLDEGGFFKSLGIHTGVRGNWYETGADEAYHAYGGVDLELPLHLYAVGEVSTKDDDVDTETPYAFGLQWRLHGVNVSLAAIQNGSSAEGVALYWGIGTGFQF